MMIFEQVESGFLSNEKLKTHLPKMLEQILISLNTDGECIIQKIANLEHSALFLKIIKNHIDPQVVQSFDVPVFTFSQDSFEIDDWDLTTRKVILVKFSSLTLVPDKLILYYL